jgi:hypothetical protein
MSLKASSLFKRPLDRAEKQRSRNRGDEARGSMPSLSRASAASTASWNKKREFVKNFRDRQTHIHTHRLKDREPERNMVRKTERQTCRQKHTHTHTHTHRQKDRET